MVDGRGGGGGGGGGGGSWDAVAASVAVSVTGSLMWFIFRFLLSVGLGCGILWETEAAVADEVGRQALQVAASGLVYWALLCSVVVSVHQSPPPPPPPFPLSGQSGFRQSSRMCSADCSRRLRPRRIFAAFYFILFLMLLVSRVECLSQLVVRSVSVSGASQRCLAVQSILPAFLFVCLIFN